MEELSFEDSEIAEQVLGDALVMMTKRQEDCLLLHQIGFTQAGIGRALGIDQRTVSTHIAAAMRNITEVSMRYR